MEGIITKIKSIFMYLGVLISAGIYTLVNHVYKIYMALASAQLLTSNMFTDIANRFYAVIGIVMLFFLTYVIIQGIVSPDTFSSKAGGEGAAILKRVLIAVLGIALVPGVFRVLYNGQDLALKEDIIGKIFLGYGKNTVNTDRFTINGRHLNSDEPIQLEDGIKEKGGTLAAISVWRATFHPNYKDYNHSKTYKIEDNKFDELADDIKSDSEKESGVSGVIRGAAAHKDAICTAALIGGTIGIFFSGGASIAAGLAVCAAAQTAGLITGDLDEAEEQKEITLKEAYLLAATTGNFLVFTRFVGSIANETITYHWLICPVIGFALLYLFFSFSIDMAVRAVKLSYMEIIAPVPLMLQILPKFKDNFNKWLKTTISLFLEVFLRLTFIYVVLFLISHLDYIMVNEAFESVNLNTQELLVAQAILIVGMLLFAKTAPQFISETLGIASGSMHLGIRQKLAESGVLGLAAGAAGLGGSLAQSGGYLTKSIVNQAKVNASKSSNGIGKFFRGAAGVAQGFGHGLKRGTANIIRAVPRVAGDVKSGKSFGDIAKAAKEGMNKSKESINAANAKAEKKREARERYSAKHPGFGRSVLHFLNPYKLETFDNRFLNNDQIADHPSKYAAERANRAIQAKNQLDTMRKLGLESTEIARDTEVAEAQERLNSLNAPDARDRIRRELGAGATEDQVDRALAQKRKDSTKALNDAKTSAFNRKVAEFRATGVHNDVTRRLSNYLIEHQEDLKKLYSTQLDVDGKKTTFGNAIQTLFGMKNGGKPTFEGAVDINGHAQLRLDITDKDSGNTRHFIYSKNGQIIHEVKSDGTLDNITIQKLHEIAANAKTGGITSSVTDRLATEIRTLDYDGLGRARGLVTIDADGNMKSQAFVEAATPTAANQRVYLANGAQIITGAGGRITISGESDAITLGTDTKNVKMGSTAKRNASNKVSIAQKALKDLLGTDTVEIDGKKYHIDPSSGKLVETDATTGSVIKEYSDTDGRTEVDVETLKKLAKQKHQKRISGLRSDGETEDYTYEIPDDETEAVTRVITDIEDLADGESMKFTYREQDVEITKTATGYAVQVGSGPAVDVADLAGVTAEIKDKVEKVYTISGTTSDVTGVSLTAKLLETAIAKNARYIVLSNGKTIELKIDGYKYDNTDYSDAASLIRAVDATAKVVEIRVAHLTGKDSKENKLKGLMDSIQEHIDRGGK